MGRLKYQDVLITEVETNIKASTYLKGLKKYEPIILDSFFQLMYFTGKKNMGTPEGDFFMYCWHQYYHAGYSLRACFILYEKGYYLEANIILRRLMEILVRMHFLEKHKELSGPVWLNKKIKIKGADGKNKKLSIKDMFNEAAPDLYRNFYGMLMSDFVHGGIGSSIGKINHKAATGSEAMLGSSWDEDSATFVVNTFTFIALGYLVYFPKVFSEGYEKIDSVLDVQYKDAVEWLRGSLENHKSKYPHSVVWHDAMKPLINI